MTIDKFCRVLALLPLGLAGPAWADTCSGSDIIMLQHNETTDMGKGLKQISIRGPSVVMSNDSMFNMLIGECSGSIIQSPEGAQSSGFCARRDKDGDTASIAWRQALGADKGEWRMLNGSGKYASRKDTGWSKTVQVDGPVMIVQWGGDCR